MFLLCTFKLNVSSRHIEEKMHATPTSELDTLQSADLDAGRVFSGKPSGTTVRGYATSSAYTPAIDPSYIFHESSRDIVVWFVKGTALCLWYYGLRQDQLHQAAQAQLSRV